MWYSLSDGTGEAKSYGFGPVKPGVPFGPGKITGQDNVLYPDKYSREISITKAQYEAMRKFGENPAAGGFDVSNYNIFNNSCVDFTWKALEKVGLNPREYQGDVLPSLNEGEVERIRKTGFAAPADNFLDFLKQIVWQINGYYTRASRLFPHQDPLALDLDGDGIETRGADGTVLFDHNGDGIRTGTGWVRSDDGLLVLDRNSNGTIDTGAELFGVHTVKADGTQASDGFDALSDLDSNNDKVFDAEDTRFAGVRIWRDLNQDGISQSNELSTLAAANIRSINLTPTAQSDLGNGNTQTASATFTRSDGTTGTAVNLNLAVNGFFRQFTNPVTLTDAAKKLPEVSGSGALRDLREAMSGSTALADLVSAYAKETSYAKRTTQLDALLTAWVGTSTLQTTRDRATANGFTLIYMAPGQSIWDSLNDVTTPLKPWPTSANCCATSAPPWRRAGWNGCNLLRTGVTSAQGKATTIRRLAAA